MCIKVCRRRLLHFVRNDGGALPKQKKPRPIKPGLFNKQSKQYLPQLVFHNFCCEYCGVITHYTNCIAAGSQFGDV